VDEPRLDLSEPFTVTVEPESLWVLTTHDDDGWMARSIAERYHQGAAPNLPLFGRTRPTALFVRRPPRCSGVRRGTTRGRRSRIGRGAARRARAPSRLGDDDPEDDDVVRAAGVAA